jgi:chromosome segregation protein
LDKLTAERSVLLDSPLQLELDSLDSSIEWLEAERANNHAQLDAVLQQIAALRPEINALQADLHQHRASVQQLNGKISSLELLQQHAMGKDNKPLSQWLEQVGLTQQPRLAEFLEVEAGWETALETVLGQSLQAICVDSFVALLDEVHQLEKTGLMLFQALPVQTASTPEASRLLSKVQCRWDLSSLLSGIYCADSLEAAQQWSLQAHESVVLADGRWLGPQWLSIQRGGDSKAGVLQREKQLRELKQQQHTLLAAIETTEQIDKAKGRHQVHTGFAQQVGEKTRRSRKEKQPVRAHARGGGTEDLHPMPEDIPAHAHGCRQRKHPHELTHHAA